MAKYKTVFTIDGREVIHNNEEELKESLQVFSEVIIKATFKCLKDDPEYSVTIPMEPPIEFLAREIFKID